MIHRKGRIQVSIGLLALGLSGQAGAADVTINAGTKYQTISGWETMLRSWELDKTNNRYDPTWVEHAPEVLDRVVNELGINRVRLEFRSGYENPVDYWPQFVAGDITYQEMRSHWYEKINDNSDPDSVNMAGFQFGEFDFLVETYVLPIKELVEANKEKLYINVCYVDFNATMNPGTMEHALAPAEYAELTKVFFDHLHDKYGIDPDGLEIILEPELTDEWRGVQIANAMIAATDLLATAGYTPEVTAPSTTSQAEVLNYFNQMLTVSGAVEKMTTLSYHRYTLGDPPAIWTAANMHGLQTAMLEHTDGDINGLIEELTQGNISAWQKFGVAVPSTTASDNGYYRADLSTPSNPVVTMGDDAKLLAPVFRYVRNGAQRIGAQSDDPNGYRPVAFINRNGSYVVAGKTNTSGTVNISGLPAATYGVRIATDAAGLMDGADIVSDGGDISLDVPAGVVTFYDKRALEGSVGSGGSGGSGGSTAGRGGSGGSTAGRGGSGGSSGGSSGTTGGDEAGAAGETGSGGSGASGGSGGSGGSGASSGGSVGGGTGGSAAASSGGQRPATAAASKEEGGCGCRVGASDTTSRARFVALALAALAFVRRRRQR